MTRRTRQSIIAGAAFAVLVCAAIGVLMPVRAAQNALDAEDRFHAAIIVHTAIEHFESVKQRRPADWEELTRAGPIESGGLEWPRDRETIQQLVEVDFGELRLADPASGAIHPTGVIYEGWKSIIYDEREPRR